MVSAFQDSFVGQLIYLASRRRLLQHVEEKDGFVLPERFRQNDTVREKRPRQVEQGQRSTEGPGTEGEDRAREGEGRQSSRSSEGTAVESEGSERNRGEDEDGGKDEAILVEWYGEDDPEKPQNWPIGKKCWTTFCIMLLTTSVYMGSSIYSPAVQDAEEYFGLGQATVTLGLSLFVLGYGCGPLFLSPISEIPQIGRCWPYIITLAIFCVLQVPTALATNFAGFAILRFLAGFVGSPPLATGGASLQDVFSMHKLPYAMGLYGLSAASGPALAPIVAGFAVESKGWRWSFWEMLWLSGFSLILLSFTMPETSSANILYRRAARLRKLTGNPNIKSQGEIDSAEMSGKDIAVMALVRPLSMTFTEPIVLAIDLYIGLIYAILYSYFESFPIVYAQGYGWKLGVSNLPFAALLIGSILSYAGFCLWNWFYFEKQADKHSGNVRPEDRLPMSMAAAFCFPICLFWFAWTANRTLWISPVIASVFFGIGTTWMFMPFLTYLPHAYPEHAASVLASNDFVRSMMGAGMPLVANPMFMNLGIAWGNTLLGCLTVLFLPIPFLLYKFGPWLRNRSPMALHDDMIKKSREEAGEEV